MQPKVGHVYTLRQMLKELALPDAPYLGFAYHPPGDPEGERATHVVQTCHCTDSELLAQPGLADSKWRYVRETYEWIPVFYYADSKPITDIVDMEAMRHPFYSHVSKHWWATPKGLPREQFYPKEQA